MDELNNVNNQPQGVTPPLNSPQNPPQNPQQNIPESPSPAPQYNSAPVQGGGFPPPQYTGFQNPAQPYPQPQYAYSYQAPAPKKGKGKFIALGIAAAVIVILGVVFAFCFKSIQIALFPEKYLASAFAKTSASFTESMSQSPMSVISEIGTVMRNGTMDCNFSAEDISVRGTFLVDTEGKEYFSDIDISAAGESVNTKLYCGEDQISLSSKEIFSSNTFYGFNPLTVAEDLDSSAFAPDSGSCFSVTDEETYELLKDLLTQIGEKENGSGEVFSADELAKIKAAFSDNCTVETGSDKLSLNGDRVSVHKVKYIFTQDNIDDCLNEIYAVMKESETFENYINLMSEYSYLYDDEESTYDSFLKSFKEFKNNFSDEIDSSIEITFFTNSHDEIVYFTVVLPDNEDYINITFNAGSSIKTTPEMSFVVSCKDGKDKLEISVVYERSNTDSDIFTDTLELTATAKSEYSTDKFKASAQSEYNKKSGDLVFSFDITPDTSYSDKLLITFDGTLKRNSDKIELDFSDSVLSVTNGSTQEKLPFSLSLSVMPGCNIEKPENFENVAAYSEKEVIALLEAIPFVDASRYTVPGFDTLNQDFLMVFIGVSLQGSEFDIICPGESFLSLIGKDNSSTVHAAIAFEGGEISPEGDKITNIEGEKIFVSVLVYQDTSLPSGEYTVYYNGTGEGEVNYYKSFEEACSAAEADGFELYTLC